MLSAGRPHQPARQIWTAFGRVGHVEPTAFTLRELWLLSCGAANDASAVCVGDVAVLRSQEASCSGRSEPGGCQQPHGVAGFDHRGIGRNAVPTAGLPGWNGAPLAIFKGTVWRPDSLHRAGTPSPGTALTQLPGGGARAFHSWYYGSKLRNRAITSIFDLDQLADTLRNDGEKLDHVNLTIFLKQLQRVAAHAATTRAAPTETGSAAAGSTAVSKAVAAAASRAVEEQVQLLTAAALRRVRKRTKWYDPRNAAAVVFSTASLGYTDGRVLHDLTSRIMTRLNEAYSRDLLVLLRGLDRHAKLSAGGPATTASGSGSAASVAPAPGAQESEVQAQKPWGARVRRSVPYSGPPAELLEGVERFMVAKIPTGRMPPENVEGILHYLRQLSPGRPVDRGVLAIAEEDLRHRLAIYAPKPLASLLAVFAAEGRVLPLDLLDAAADQFARHADSYGSGGAAARFLTAVSVLLRNGSGAGGGEGDAAAAATTSGSGTPGPTVWISARPEILAQCLKLMTKDVPRADAERLASWLAALSHAEVPLSSLAAAGSSGSGTAVATEGAGAAAAAAAAFVRAHGAAVEAALPRLSPDQLTRLRKAYDNTGLQYPKGL